MAADPLGLLPLWLGHLLLLFHWYVQNGQRDIIGITDNAGTVVVSYTYDAWGNPIATTGSLAATVGAVNPLRYRGYYYDVETGWYYLNSRYYDPAIGRFINADGYASTGQGVLGTNMFIYCLNNPVNRIDPNGCNSIITTSQATYTYIGSIETAEQAVIDGLFFTSPRAAANAWAETEGQKTVEDNRERIALILFITFYDSETGKDKTYYFFSRTLTGTEESVLVAFLTLYSAEAMLRFPGIQCVGVVHSHPLAENSGSNYTPRASNGDRALLYLPGIKYSFIYDVTTDCVFADGKAFGQPEEQVWDNLMNNPHGVAPRWLE